MAERQAREFEDTPAAREKTPILFGLTGASGGGKTFSALRVATGIVSVTGGDIFVIDTDNRRALQYADLFKFRHVPFNPPHSSLAYVDAIRFAVRRGAGCIIIDSMSHEHEGVGGMIEFHEAELDRLAGDDYGKRERMKMIAWAAPKAARRKLILEIQRLNVPTIFCFRAKQTAKPIKVGNKTEVVQQGFTPIAGEEFVFEMTMNALLLPGSKGVPTWNPENPGERIMTKLPAQFEVLERVTAPMDEKLGESLAKWSLGGVESKRRAEPPEERQDAPHPSDGPDTRDEPPPPSSAPESDPGDDFPGDRPSGASRGAEEPKKPAAGAEDFGAFADVLAVAEDWPAIATGLRTLTASAGWKAANPEMQRRARILAYQRLVELNEKGLRFDYLRDAHAFRCYIEAEEDREALALNFLTFKTCPPWQALNDAARQTFVAAVDARCSILDAGNTATESFA